MLLSDVSCLTYLSKSTCRNQHAESTVMLRQICTVFCVGIFDHHHFYTDHSTFKGFE